MVNSKALASSIIGVIVTIIIVFQIIGGTGKALTDAADNVTNACFRNCSGTPITADLPLNALFASDGIIYIIFMAGILLLAIGLVLKKKYKGM